MAPAVGGGARGPATRTSAAWGVQLLDQAAEAGLHPLGAGTRRAEPGVRRGSPSSASLASGPAAGCVFLGKSSPQLPSSAAETTAPRHCERPPSPPARRNRPPASPTAPPPPTSTPRRVTSLHSRPNRAHGSGADLACFCLLTGSGRGQRGERDGGRREAEPDEGAAG